MKKRLSFLFLLLFGFISSLCSQSPGFRPKADSLLTYLSNENLFSGRVLLQKNDSVLYRGEFNLIPNGTIRYRIGSITKVFTAILIYQLIDEGKLSLETKLSRFFPEIRHAGEITIEQMLSHCSGIYDVTSWEGYYGSRNRIFYREDVVKLITGHKPEFKPGKDCSYSNSNYILLGYIIQDVTGHAYAENVNERIAKPLHLSDTYCEVGKTDLAPREKSYKFDGEHWLEDIDSEPSLPFSAGAIVSTNEDLATLMVALFQHKLISDSSLSVMKSLKSRSIGHGFMKAPFYDKPGWGHSGRIDEFRAFAGYFPNDSLVITITTNGMCLKGNELLIGVLSAYYGKEYNYPTVVKTDITEPPASDFYGRYKARLWGFLTVGRLIISEAGRNHLFMREDHGEWDSEKSLLVRTGAYTFFSNAAGSGITFTADKKGKIKGFELRQGKVKIKGKKIYD